MMSMKHLKCASLLLLALFLFGCQKKNQDNPEASVLFDGFFSQVSIESDISMAELPREKDTALNLWYEIDRSDRVEIAEAMGKSFAEGVEGFSVYFSLEDRFLFSLSQDNKDGYNMSMNTESDQWIVTYDELIQ